MPVIASTYIYVGLTIPSNLAITPLTFIFWITTVLLMDGCFGFIHYLNHITPALRKLHMVHHEYRKEDLNSAANFYADILDSFLMNIPNIMFSILTVWLSVNPIVIKEGVYNALFIHHKYPNNQMTLLYYFEFELIDIIMNRARMNYYHNVHHQQLEKNYSFWGFISDNSIIQLHQYMKRVLYLPHDKK
jgi:sterol desaturase/sphingolipid hydroxylase (fatty acid hydroxylase superfamily)